MKTERVNVLGVGVDAVDQAATLDQIGEHIRDRTPGYIVLAPAHNVIAARDDPALRAIFGRSALTVPDGMGVVWFLRASGAKAVGRVYGPDLLLAACERGLPLEWRHYFLGGSPGLAERLADGLASKRQGLRVVGAYAPPFEAMTQQQTDQMLRQIEQAQADIVWVGLGSPKQERWMAEFRERLSAPVLIGVGAAFDFLTDAKRQAPRWVQRIGMEWLFRLLNEPRRLWRRYIHYPRFVLLAMGQLLGMLRFPLSEDH